MWSLTIIGLLLRMCQIRPMRGVSISSMAMTIGIVRAMRISLGVLEVESENTRVLVYCTKWLKIK